MRPFPAVGEPTSNTLSTSATDRATLIVRRSRLMVKQYGSAGSDVPLLGADPAIRDTSRSSESRYSQAHT